jgi:epoxyqueuosine reductase
MKDLLHLSQSELAELGIVEWGYTTETVPRTFEQFKRWLPGNAEKLPFLSLDKNIAYRSDLKVWWPEAKSALVFLFSYAPAKKALLEAKEYRVAGYTLGFDGEDYHGVMKERLHHIGRKLQEKYALEFKHSHDTEPILERDLAYRAGVGWFGKNALIINRQLGSYFVLGSLILDTELPLASGEVSPDHCGQCRACVDACPTEAIDPVTRSVKASQCISTWTIEDRSADTPAPLGLEKARGEVFGCDICQDVCPWNQKSLPQVTAELGPGAKKWLQWFSRPYEAMASEILSFTNRGYLRETEGSVFGRPGRPSLLRTLSFWLKNPPR